MKNRLHRLVLPHRLLTSVASLFMVLSLINAAEPSSIETAEIKLRTGEKLMFRAHALDSKGDRQVTSGYTNYEGQLYKSQMDPPIRILVAGHIIIDGKEVTLDVSGLADPWIESKELTRRFVQLQGTEGASPIRTLFVCFARGGATDYVVEWIIKDGRSFRLAVTDCGDKYPDWVK